MFSWRFSQTRACKGCGKRGVYR